MKILNLGKFSIMSLNRIDRSNVAQLNQIDLQVYEEANSLFIK